MLIKACAVIKSNTVHVMFDYYIIIRSNRSNIQQVPVITGMSHTRNSRWSMLVHMNEAETG